MVAAAARTDLYRVVIADDVADLRFLLSRALENSGRFRVVGTAADGREAVRVAAQQQPDLTLLDLSMPVLDGLEALPMIRARAPDGVVVVLSGLDADDVVATARERGAVGYLVKGIGPDDLVDELLTLLAEAHPQRRPAPSHDARAHIELPAELRSGSQARRFVMGCLDDWELESLADTALLLTTELVTNAVLHAGTNVGVTVRCTHGRLRVEVGDTGPGALIMRRSGADATTGRGLQLMEALAHRWGTSTLDSGKLVWFELQADR
ncbi:MAG TPA: response regulator [Egibacteraceae bacterium]|nr:response regulator [Egibacteraceae bacterium]